MGDAAMPKEVNGVPIITNQTQEVPCGAVLLLDDKALKYGIVLVHPELPLFKLYLKIDPKTKHLSQHFEKVIPTSKLVKDFAIRIVEDEATIIQPKTPGLIT